MEGADRAPLHSINSTHHQYTVLVRAGVTTRLRRPHSDGARKSNAEGAASSRRWCGFFRSGASMGWPGSG